MSVGVFVILDHFGHRVVGIGQNYDDLLNLHGLVDSDGTPAPYRDRCGDAPAWAASKGFTCVVHSIELDLDTQSVLDWKIIA